MKKSFSPKTLGGVKGFKGLNKNYYQPPRIKASKAIGTYGLGGFSPAYMIPLPRLNFPANFINPPSL